MRTIEISENQLLELKIKAKIKELLNRIEEKAYKNLNRAMNSGCLSNEYLEDDNYLLAKFCIWELRNEFAPKSTQTKKEYENIEKFV